MKQNIGAAIGIGQKSEALAAVEPFHDPGDFPLLIVVISHFAYLSPSDKPANG
ncbi:hypothetical protein RM190_14195 [Paracoccus sp. CPCC 101403]|uniref:Uncharacterized protein n=1 Tax=Paracoccus broussonetiae TaxID=3075834 RepID=A0ABU3EFL3_9RHOB|nr:hypothetical protein [Paracoccus sp. CPCC 101403]